MEKGVTSVQNESDQEVINHVFDTGFSTRQTVTELSGRGVGMDSIRNSALQIGGTVLVTSEMGKGTSLILEFPHAFDS
jgi:two-component system chemotaxis sensor kinase CheA